MSSCDHRRWFTAVQRTNAQVSGLGIIIHTQVENICLKTLKKTKTNTVCFSAGQLLCKDVGRKPNTRSPQFAKATPSFWSRLKNNVVIETLNYVDESLTSTSRTLAWMQTLANHPCGLAGVQQPLTLSVYTKKILVTPCLRILGQLTLWYTWYSEPFIQ